MEEIAKPLDDILPSQACLARQPILNDKSQIVAYELLFRRFGSTTANVSDNTVATYTVITDAFTNIGINAVLGNKTAFINIDSAFLQSDILHLLPKDRVVFEILETVDVTTEVLDTLRELRKHNYIFALDDFVYHENRAALIEFADIIKIDITLLNQEQLIEHVNIFKKMNKKLLAEKVETINQFELCKSLGFTLFQGFFFAKPTTLTQKKIPSNKLSILEIMNKLSTNVDNEKLINLISHDLSLSYKLLTFINSAGSTCGKELESVDAALAMLGREPLYRWLSVLLFLSKDKSSLGTEILFELAIYRGKLFEICAELRAEKNTHELFILGAFSCLETLLNQSFETIFKDLVAPLAIKQALLEQSGPYYMYLELMEALDSADVSKIENSCSQLGIVVADINTAQLTATAYCESLSV